MTAFDPTTVLPVVTGAVPAEEPVDSRSLDEGRLDELIDLLAEPVGVRPPVEDRVVAAARELTSTPRRAAATTTWIFAAAGLAAVWLDRPTVSVQTSAGPARARCGLDVFVYGNPDPVITRACRHAEAVHFGLFLPTLVVVLAGVAGAALVLLRRGGSDNGIWSAAREAPVQSTLTALGSVALVVAGFALNPVSIQLVNAQGVISAHCGADTYFFGYPSGPIQSACQRSYAAQGHLLVAAVIVVVVGAAALTQLLYTRRSQDRWARRRVLTVACGLVLAVIAVVASLPVNVDVDEHTAPVVASCGLDTFVAGYPDQVVQSACRAHFATHAAIGMAGGTLATMILVWAFAAPGRKRNHPETAAVQ